MAAREWLGTADVAVADHTRRDLANRWNETVRVDAIRESDGWIRDKETVVAECDSGGQNGGTVAEVRASTKDDFIIPEYLAREDSDTIDKGPVDRSMILEKPARR
jgi:prophage tail gpP-like protein